MAHGGNSSSRKIHFTRCSGNRTTDNINRKKNYNIRSYELQKIKCFLSYPPKKNRRQKMHRTEEDEHCRSQI